MAEHVHDFEPIISRPKTPPYFEFISGYKPCACGMERSEWLASLAGGRIFDPVANLQAAVRYMAARYGLKVTSGYRTIGGDGPGYSHREYLDQHRDDQCDDDVGGDA